MCTAFVCVACCAFHFLGCCAVSAEVLPSFIVQAQGRLAIEVMSPRSSRTKACMICATDFPFASPHRHRRTTVLLIVCIPRSAWNGTVL
jgi:hypothetical protein